MMTSPGKRHWLERKSVRRDATAGLVVGIESVPDGLAGGLLAGVNPVYGLYAYLVGTVTGAIFTSSAFMAVQATGAMAIIVADVDVVHDAEDPGRALFTLSIVTGVIMLAAGLLKLGSTLRFVSNAVMVGFISAVGVNIILGQLADFTGYEGEGGNRVVRALDTLLNLRQADGATMLIGVATIALIVMLERSRLGPLGMVVAIVATSAAVGVFGLDTVAQLGDIADIPSSLPRPTWPLLGLVPALLIPAFSLAFVGLVQGASITANFPNPDGTYPDASRDFVGQGAANVAAGVFQAMPVGGSMSGTSLAVSAGARSRLALILATVVMAVVILVFGDAVSLIAMPALAGLLMLVGYRTIKPGNMVSVWKTGRVQAVVLAVTFGLTMLIPLQYAVLVGVGLSVVLHVIRQSNQVTIKQRVFEPSGEVTETAPPGLLPHDEVIVLQPYGSLFFASAPIFEKQMPEVTATSRNTVVILRLRGRSDLGTTFMDVLRRYALSLQDVDSKLMLVSTDRILEEQFAVTGVTEVVGADNIYSGTERIGTTLKRAHSDAVAWVAANKALGSEPA
ncbi:MAG TPA: SulP family inorganic anion transporter [Acidimicrobiia bacterium]